MRRLIALALAALVALASIGTAFADQPSCPEGFTRHGNECVKTTPGNTIEHDTRHRH